MEGLIDAYNLAVKVDDEARVRSYRRVIVRGLRSLMQLQFGDDIYVIEPERVRGAVRTTVYDNEIRVDNVQHNLLAVLKILETFTPTDFSWGSFNFQEQH